jgi:polysaccharide deacetylase family protein (PEP-CTERM system associated)
MTGASHAVLTVDVEEWFHICGVGGPLAPEHWPSLPSRVNETTTRLLDLLDRANARATFFVLGYVAERAPALVGLIASAGHEVASHGHMHTRVYELTRDTFAADLDRSVAAISACGVKAVRGFRAPEWSINNRSLWALDVLARKGFLYDSSMAPMPLVGDASYPTMPHRRVTTAGAIVECPPAVAKRLAWHAPFGGGWGLRMSRPSAVLKELEHRAGRGLPSVLWVHPWEIDDDPPRVSLPWPQHFAHYFRLEGFAHRLETILTGAAFGPLGPVALATTQ